MIGIKSEGMWAKHKGKALVSRNDYVSSTMADVPPLPDYKVVLPKGKFNRLCTHYNICTDLDLIMGWAVLRCIACGCRPFKDQLEMPWIPRNAVPAQPHYA